MFGRAPGSPKTCRDRFSPWKSLRQCSSRGNSSRVRLIHLLKVYGLFPRVLGSSTSVGSFEETSNECHDAIRFSLSGAFSAQLAAFGAGNHAGNQTDRKSVV